MKKIAIVIIIGLMAAAMYRVVSTNGQGQAVYQQNCSACHARGIAGAPVFGDKGAWTHRIAKGKEALYASALNGLNAMPPRGGKTNAADDEIRSAVDYMLSQSGY